MARTIAQIKDELDRIFPPEWSDNDIGNAILYAIATALASRESEYDGADGWFEQLFRQTADGIYLDAHGADVDVDRLSGELDDTYRERAVLGPKILTEGNAVDSFNLFLPASGYSVFVTEPYYTFLDDPTDGFYLNDPTSLLVEWEGEDEPRFLFWIFIPLPEVVYVYDSFLDLDAYLDVDAYLDEAIDDLNRRHIRQILAYADQFRAYGIAFGVTVADFPQLPYYLALYETGSGGYV